MASSKGQNEEKKDQDAIIFEMIKATKESGQRVRYVLIIIITASILAFAAFWNGISFSWKQNRLERLMTLCEYISKDDSIMHNFKNMVSESGKKKIIEDWVNQFPETVRKSLEKAIEYFQPEKLGKTGIQHLLNNYKTFEEDNVNTIKVPFFGITFDINDLGIISGFSFIIILLIFQYSLDREMQNIRKVDRYIKNEFEDRKKASEFYYILLMNQLFSLSLASHSNSDNHNATGTNSMRPEKRRIIRVLRTMTRVFRNVWFLIVSPKSLFILPVILLFVIVIYDCLTIKIGLKINCEMTIIKIFFSFIFLLALFYLWKMCNIIAKEIEKYLRGIEVEIEN